MRLTLFESNILNIRVDNKSHNLILKRKIYTHTHTSEASLTLAMCGLKVREICMYKVDGRKKKLYKEYL